MAMGTRKKRERQEPLWWGELPTAPGHPFYIFIIKIPTDDRILAVSIEDRRIRTLGSIACLIDP